jgi:hypothetical protein
MIVFYPHLTPLVCLVLITNAPRLIKLTNSRLVFLAPASHPSPRCIRRVTFCPSTLPSPTPFSRSPAGLCYIVEHL